MVNHRLYSILISLGVCGLAGCSYFQSTPDPNHPYPSSPPGVKSETATTETASSAVAAVPAVVKVPASAQELSHGDYPPPGFHGTESTGNDSCGGYGWRSNRRRCVNCSKRKGCRQANVNHGCDQYVSQHEQIASLSHCVCSQMRRESPLQVRG